MGRGGDSRRAGGGRVTVGEAAALWGVSRATVYNWIHVGLVTFFEAAQGRGEVTAARADVLAARVLGLRTLRALGIAPDDVARAERSGLVRPSSARGEARLSLDDAEAILAFEAGPRLARGERPPPRQSGFVLKTLEARVDRERAWVARGAHPSERSDDEFDGPEPPSVIPPAGVFFYEPVDSVPDQPGARYVRRSKGYDYVDGQLEWFEDDDRFAVLRAGERPRPEWTRSNQLYRHAKRRWLAEWERRRRRRGAR